MPSAEERYYQPVNSFEVGEGRATRRMEPVKKYRQFLAAVIANLSSFAVGTCLGWTSPIMPKLQNLNMTDTPLSEPIAKNSEDEAWVGSLVALSALIAPFIAGYFADKIGRKWTIMSSAVFLVLAYVVMMLAKKVWMLMLGRLIQGLGTGFVMTVTPMYVGEISTDDCRGATGSLMQLFIVGGILYVYAIGPYVSYMALQSACIVIPIIFAVTFFFMPDSPYYFAGKGRKFDAIKSLEFLRGQSSQSVQNEMTEIQTAVEESQRNKGSITDIFTNKGNLKALIICSGLLIFQQLSGINVVLFNSETIFEDAKSSLDPAVATILVGAVQVISSGITPLIVDRLGRKPILLTSAGCMSISLISLGSFFYIKSTDADISAITWLPVTSLIIYVIVYCIGFGPLPWAVLGEMFPGNVKSIASSINASACWTLGFIITRWYPALNNVGPHYAFFLFGGCCVLAFFFVMFIVMETKGLSLAQIQERLNGK